MTEQSNPTQGISCDAQDMKRLGPTPGKVFVLSIILSWALSILSGISFAAPTLTGVEPAVGQVGQNLEVDLHGSGFDENSRVLFYPDSGKRMKILGSAKTVDARNVAVECNTAYITAGSSLKIVDVAITSDPVLRSTTALPSFGMAIAVRNSLAYVLTEQHGLYIFDVTDPFLPVKLGQVALPNGSLIHYGIFLAGQYAYAAVGSAGLYVINVADPRHPSVAGHVATSGAASGVSVSGQWAYVSVLEFGLQVFDISNPAVPVLKVSFPMGKFPLAMDVFVLGQTAYVLSATESGLFGLQVINLTKLSDPNPVIDIIGSLYTAGLPLKIDVSGERAYIAALDFGLYVIDLSVPGNPILLGSISQQYAMDVVYANGLAYLAESAGGMEIVDVGRLNRSSIISSVPSAGLTEGLTVTNTTAYIAASDGLQLYDISNPDQPQLIATVPSSIDAPVQGWPLDVVIRDNIAYVAHSWGLRTIDVSDSEHPLRMGWAQIGDGSLGDWEVAVIGTHAYVAAYENGLQLVDITKIPPDPPPEDPPPEDPIIGSWDTYASPLAARGVVIVNSTAYVADEGAGLVIIDVSDPDAEPRIITPPTGGKTMDVAVAGNFAYLAMETGGLQIVDISNPTAPFLRGNLGAEFTAGYEVYLVGQTAYIASALQGVLAVDVSNPDEPIVLATIPTIDFAYDLSVAGNAVFVADTYAGLCILAAPREILPDSVAGDLMTAALPGDFKGDYTIKVFDATGSAELPGAVTFLDQLPEAKAVIVAGYGPHPSNKLWDETLVNANHAWNVLAAQGYPRENIRYLSSVPVDADGDGTPDVDGDATLAQLQSALNWAADANDLLLYLVGHGSSKNFVMKHTDTLHEELASWKLAGWLDDLQADHGMRAVGVLEACYSGSFLDALQLEQGAGFERTLLTSSAASQVSILGNNGCTSFSHRFWESLYEQGELVRAFTEASDMMAGFGQTPWLDGNCDGLPNTAADSARETVVGRGYNFQSPLKPFVSCTSPDRVLRNTKSALLWAKTVSTNPVSRVWAEIIPPGYDPLAPDAPPLPTVELTWSESRRRYEGSYGQFIKRGTYHVALYARDNQQVVSLPRISRFTVPLFPWNLFLPAVIFKE